MTEPIALDHEGSSWTRAQIDGLAAGLAARLARRGVQRGERIALMSSNRPEFLVAVLAIWRLGAAAVLISPAWKRAEVEHALAVTKPADAIGDHPVLAALMPMLSLDQPVPIEDGAEPASAGLDSDALLVFSSGTTGLPKAVRHTHRSFGAAVAHWRAALGLTSDDRMQVTTPPSHILGILNLITALETGVRVRLHTRFDLERVLHHIEEDRVTVEMAVAPIALAIANHPDLEKYDLSSLRYIMWGATPVTPSVAEAVTRRTGVGWVPAYGTSELPVIACNPLAGARLDTVGKAVPGVEIRVTDPASGSTLPPGETGEIEVRAESMMAGYLPAGETDGVLHHGWYRTGDVGNVDAAGWVRITDRSKEMIKVRGFAVAPAEIERVLHGHPAVSDCAVFGVPDPADGEAVIAAVSTSAEVSAAELIALVGERLASYKRPREVLFVSGIPRLPSGKALRRILREDLLKERDGRPADR